MSMKACRNCNSLNHPKAFRCKYCELKFPVSIQDKEKIIQKGKEKSSIKKVWEASGVLFFIGGIISLVGIWLLMLSFSENRFGVFSVAPLTIGLFFIFLGIWSNTRPFYALLTGTISYTLLVLYMTIYTWAGTVLGLLIMVGIGVYLYIGLFNAQRKQTLKMSEDILDA